MIKNLKNTTEDRKANPKSLMAWVVLSILPIFTAFAFLKIRKIILSEKGDDAKKRTSTKTSYFVVAAVLSLYIAFGLSIAVFYICNLVLGFPIIVAIILSFIVGVATTTLFLMGVVNKDMSFKAAFFMSGTIVSVAVAGIIVFIFITGMPIFFEVGFFRFIFGRTWYINPDNPSENIYGVFPMIMGTFVAGIGALIFGGGLGVLTAVFISRFCHKKIKPVVTQAVNMLAGIPSVVYGFFGLEVIVPMFNSISPNGSGTGPLAVALVLGIMILPTVVALSRTSIDAVEKSYYEGAVALGSRDSSAVFRVVLPGAKSGVMASLILGLGRAVGETMAVIMVAGNSTFLPTGPFEAFRTLTTNIVFEMSYASDSLMNALLGTAVVLMITVLLINIAFNLLKRKDSDKPSLTKKLFLFIKYKLVKGRVASGTANVPKAKKNFSVSNYGADTGQRHDKIALEPPQKIRPLEQMVSRSFFAKLIKIIPPFFKVLTFISSALAIVALVGITAFILINGLPHISLSLLTGEFTFNGPRTIAPSIITTLMVILLSGIIAFPLGIACAVFLNEYSKRGSKIAKIIELAVETLAGIPSILYGMFGGIFFVVTMNLGASITAGSLTMALMLLPISVRTTQESLKSVPNTFREGSLALGAGKARTIFRVVLPNALPGIVAMIILGIGRVVAETAALIFTMGGSLGGMPEGFGSPGTTLAVAFYRLTQPGIYDNEAYATASILIMIVFVLNILATIIYGKLKKKKN
ncbi:MAG: phosphate ABC transporter permease subunit PstC [Firmicutes bacterium]|nr:phosphate ABC transporter permease subunit PstC [Bacillota bacterium]